MNTEGGSLEFEALLNNQQLVEAIDEAERRVKGFSSATVAESEKIDDAFQVTADNIKIQKDVIDKLENEVANLGKQIESMEPGEGQNKVIEQARSAKKELEAEKEALKILESQINKTYDTFDVTNENIRIQKDVIAELEQQVKALDAEIGKLAPGKAQSEMRQQAAEVKAELAAETEALRVLESQVQTTEKAHVSFRTRIRELKESLIEMEAAGLRNTQKYNDARNELATLTDAMADATAQANILAHDQKGMQGLISGLTGITGAFSAAQGAIGLFAGENENLQKIMLKVQSLMAITIGLQQVEQMLNKDSAFTLVIVAKAKTMLAVATSGLATALGISTVAAQALLATLTLGLSAAITAIVVLISKFSSKSAEAKKAVEEFNKAVVECGAKPIAAIQELFVAWNRLGNSLKEKEKFIIENANRFEELGLKIKDVKDAEAILSSETQKNKFILSMVQKAKAMASAELAATKYKEALLKQLELENTPEKIKKTKTITDPETGRVLSSYDYEIDNEDHAKLKAEKEKLEKEGLELFNKSAEFTAKEKEILKELGVSTNNIVEGSIAALEQNISRLKEKYKTAANDTDRKALFTQIKAQEDLLLKMDQSGSKSDKDPFKESLDKRKKLYQQYLKWVNSNDPVVKKAAETEFASLLKEGKSYLDYLQKQRQQLMSVDTKTAEQQKRLKTLNDQIAEETTKTVLQSFDDALQKQMSSATSVIQMLDIIAEKRKEISGDGTDLDKGKKDIVDKAEKDVSKQASEETKQLLDEYASYYDKRLRMHQKYIDDIKLLEKRLKDAQTPEEKEKVQGVIDNRRVQYQKDSKGTGDEDFDALKKEYRTYQQQMTDIQEEYAEKRRIATLHNDTLMLAQLAEAEGKELSSLANKQLTSSVDWQKLFGNLSELTTSTINDLIGKVEAQKIQFGGEFDPKDLQVINEQLQKAKDEINQRNPFVGFANALSELRENLKNKAIVDESDPFIQEMEAKKQEYDQFKQWVESGNATLVNGSEQAFSGLMQQGKTYLDFLKNKKKELSGKIDMSIDDKNAIVKLDALIARQEKGTGTSENMKKSLQETFSSVSGSLGMLKGAFDSVIGGLNSMGMSGDEVTQQLMSDIGGMIDGAGQMAEGIATSNPIAVIQGSIGLLTSAFEVFNIKDRKKEREIQKHKKAVESLKEVYQDLERAVDKALGGDQYKNQKQMINNLRQQQQHFSEMAEAERGKKKSDNEKIKEYEQSYKEAGQKIEDIWEEISQDILQTNAKDAASQLGDALVEAFGKGEDAATAFGKTANDIMKQAVLNQLKKNFLEKQLQGALDGLEKSMGHWVGDNFVFDGLTPAEQAKFKAQIESIGKNFSQALGVYENLFKDLQEDVEDTSLSGAVKGVSEETASIVAGQINAVRINQIEVLNLIRQQLIALNQIAANTAFNHHLAKLTQIVELLQGSNNQTDPLRASGLS